MNVKLKISYLLNTEEFVASPSQKDKIYSSFSSSENPVGILRWEEVSNGRYGHYHPVHDKTASTIGYLVGGAQELGYTYCCLYSDQAQRFFVSHVPFGMVWGGGSEEKYSFISTVEMVGKFWLFKKGLKYKKTSSFSFPGEWVGSEHIYRFIDNGRSLLCVSGFGFCLIDVSRPSLMVNEFFGNKYAHMVTGVEISPNEKILLITMCEWSYTDPVKGEEVYKNTLQIYDVNNGKKIGDQDLAVGRSVSKCNICFNKNGNIVALSSDKFSAQFKLEVISSN